MLRDGEMDRKDGEKEKERNRKTCLRGHRSREEKQEEEQQDDDDDEAKGGSDEEERERGE